jgi:predicted chitinase
MQSMGWGLGVVLAMFPESNSKKNVVKYFPLVEAALNDFGLVDTKVKLVSYASIRAESAGFRPIAEQISKLNTLRPVEVSNLKNPNLRDLAEISNTLLRQYRLDNKFGLYDYRKTLDHHARGDGERYKGRGFIQLTGRSNYLQFSKTLKH